jgi:hypothetical protein
MPAPALVLALLLIAPTAQPESVNVGGQQWRAVEPTVGDLGPLNTGGRVMPVDMRAASNFDRLYKLDVKPRFFGDRSLGEYYMRRSGAVAAIFPRSSYRMVRGGLAAEVPAGTIFSLGGDLGRLIQAPPPPPRRNIFSAQALSPQPQERAGNPNRVDYRVPQSPTAPPAPPARPGQPRNRSHLVYPEEREPLPRSIWYDERYRHERISALLDEASQAG